MSDIRLQEIELREIRLPLREPFVISSGTEEDRRILLLRVTDADGISVWSECVAGARPNYSCETVDTARHAIETWLAPLVLGRAFEDPADVDAAWREPVKGHPMAKASIEMACHALVAHREGISLARSIGGTRPRVATGISIGLQPSTGELVAKAEAAVALGYRKVKLKISPGADVEPVAAVREALGPDVDMAVDANAAYTLQDAEPIRRLDDFGLIMIEQPLAAGDLVRHARLQESLSTPICLDESIVGPASAEDMLTLGSGRIINIKPGRVGGFTASKAIHDLASAADVPVWCGGMLESGIGRAYNVALASLPNFRLPGDLSPSARYWERDIVRPEWTMSADGEVEVPVDRPGLGVEVDRDRIEDLTVRAGALVPGPAAPAEIS